MLLIDFNYPLQQLIILQYTLQSTKKPLPQLQESLSGNCIQCSFHFRLFQSLGILFILMYNEMHIKNKRITGNDCKFIFTKIVVFTLLSQNCYCLLLLPHAPLQSWDGFGLLNNSALSLPIFGNSVPLSNSHHPQVVFHTVLQSFLDLRLPLIYIR